jgi:hypothetical protein
MSPKNPLTPRVAVNTVWSHLFGHGLVTSLEDFGARASLPSHPELLDWLAGDFVRQGFSRKRLIKQLVMSATYRQSSVLRPEVTADPENKLLYRQNRLRVEAEVVADTFLFVSGLLLTKRGGPAVYPPLPPELKGVSFDGIEWPTSSGEDAHRRALYTWHQRMQLYPSLAAFDRPSATVSVSGRSRSNTPLQPLVTLHDPVFVEAAQAFAQRVQRERSGSLAEQLAHAFRLALGRPASLEEVAELQRLYDSSKLALVATPDAGASTMGSYPSAHVDTASAAAWVSLARAILNLDELVTRE